MPSSNKEIKQAIGSPLAGKKDAMQQTLKARKTSRKKKPDHISIQEEKRENKLRNYKKRRLAEEEKNDQL